MKWDFPHHKSTTAKDSKPRRGAYTELPTRLGHYLITYLTPALPVMPHKSFPQETWLFQPAKRLNKSMRLLWGSPQREESLSIRRRALGSPQSWCWGLVSSYRNMPWQKSSLSMPGHATYHTSSGAGRAAVTGHFVGAMHPPPRGWVGPTWHIPARSHRTVAITERSSQGSVSLMHSQCLQSSDSIVPVQFLVRRALEKLISMQNVLLRKRSSPVGTWEPPTSAGTVRSFTSSPSV